MSISIQYLKDLDLDITLPVISNHKPSKGKSSEKNIFLSDSSFIQFKAHFKVRHNLCVKTASDGPASTFTL